MTYTEELDGLYKSIVVHYQGRDGGGGNPNPRLILSDIIYGVMQGASCTDEWGIIKCIY